VQKKIESIRPIDPEVQKDFKEVWKNIEESIQKYEKGIKKEKKKNKPAINRTVTNLNFKS
jgi:hypothetical protein